MSDTTVPQDTDVWAGITGRLWTVVQHPAKRHIRWDNALQHIDGNEHPAAVSQSALEPSCTTRGGSCISDQDALEALIERDESMRFVGQLALFRRG